MLALPVIGLASPDLAAANDFEIRKGKDLKVSIPKDHRPVLTTALSMLGRDLRSVFGDTASVVSSNPDVKIEINPSVVADPQGFLMEVTPEGTLSITGHDSHGAAYALMECRAGSVCHPGNGGPTLRHASVILSSFRKDSLPGRPPTWSIAEYSSTMKTGDSCPGAP